jgi:hypothetical protein
VGEQMNPVWTFYSTDPPKDSPWLIQDDWIGFALPTVSTLLWIWVAKRYIDQKFEEIKKDFESSSEAKK